MCIFIVAISCVYAVFIAYTLSFHFKLTSKIFMIIQYWVEVSETKDSRGTEITTPLKAIVKMFHKLTLYHSPSHLSDYYQSFQFHINRRLASLIISICHLWINALFGYLSLLIHLQLSQYHAELIETTFTVIFITHTELLIAFKAN